MKRNIVIFIVIITIISLSITGLTFYAYCRSDFFDINRSLDTERLGNFGGFIGGILGSLLTIIATILIYLTYQSQSEELRFQKELIQTQQFETSFYNLLNTHRELKNSLKINHPKDIRFGISEYEINKEELHGVEIFEEVNNYLKYLYLKMGEPITIDVILQQSALGYNNKEIEEKKEKFKNYQIEDWTALKTLNYLYEDVFKKYQNQISHYCRNVYHIVKFIRENEKRETKTNPNASQKYKQYANLFQSQLNVNEQFLLFYNFINFDDPEKGIFSTVNLVNHYKFIENIGIDNLILKKHEEFYNFQIKGSDRVT